MNATPAPCDWCPLPGGCPRRFTPPACDWYLQVLAATPITGPVAPEPEVHAIHLPTSPTVRSPSTTPAQASTATRPTPRPTASSPSPSPRSRAASVAAAVTSFLEVRRIAQACPHRRPREQTGGCNCAGVCDAGRARRPDGVVTWRDCYSCVERSLTERERDLGQEQVPAPAPEAAVGARVLVAGQ